jgi:lysozyme
MAGLKSRKSPNPSSFCPTPMPRKKKKKNNFSRLALILLLFTAALLGYVYRNPIYYLLNYYDNRETNFTLYPGFGIPLPENYEIHGIDVSRYQSRINWPLVKQMDVADVKIGFAFIKATEGAGLTDKTFYRNWIKSKKSGIVRGAYHFFIAAQSGRAQAKNFIKQVHLEPGDLPPVLDVENLNGYSSKAMQDGVAEFLKTVEAHYHVKPIIYSNANFYTTHLQERFSEYPLWVAHYFEPSQPRVDADWHFWQHSDLGSVNGISGKVDFNVYSGDSSSFKRLLIR